MTTRETNFWLTKATLKDISDPQISTTELLRAIEPEITPVMPDNLGFLLDIGCGYGRITRELKRIYGKTAIVVGVDINQQFLDRAMAFEDEQPPFYFRLDYKELNKLHEQHAIICTQLLQHLPEGEKLALILSASLKLKHKGIFRFQFVEGDTDIFLTRDTSAERMLEFCEAAGLAPLKVDMDLVCPKWTWITAEKIGDPR